MIGGAAVAGLMMSQMPIVVANIETPRTYRENLDVVTQPIPALDETVTIVEAHQPRNPSAVDEVSSAQSQHVGRRNSRHHALRHSAQYFNPVKFALAHDYQSPGHTPILLQTLWCDTSTLQM